METFCFFGQSIVLKAVLSECGKVLDLIFRQLVFTPSKISSFSRTLSVAERLKIIAVLQDYITTLSL